MESVGNGTERNKRGVAQGEGKESNWCIRCVQIICDRL